MDPFTTAALVSGGFNALGSLFGMGASNSAAKASLQATRETNATNERLVKEMNAFNALQQDKQNEYNSLKQQKKRALEAGFNPNILSGNNSLPSSVVTQSQIAGQSSGADILMQKGLSQASMFQSLGHSADAITDAQLKEAQRKKLNIETKKQELENTFIPQLRQGELALQDMNVKLGEKSRELSDSQISLNAQKLQNMQQEIVESNQRIAESVQKIENMTTENRINLIEEAFRSKEIQARINQMASSAGLNYQQAYDLCATRAARIAGLESSAELNKRLGIESEARTVNIGKQSVGLDIQNKQFKLDYEINNEFKYVDKTISLVGDCMGIVTDAFNIAKFFRPKSQGKGKK